MSKRAASSSTDIPSKKRRIHLCTVTPSTSAPRPSGTRHVRLTQSGNRLTQRRKYSKKIATLPSNDSVIEPDGEIDEWINEGGDEDTSAKDVRSTALKKKKKSKSTSVSTCFRF